MRLSPVTQIHTYKTTTMQVQTQSNLVKLNERYVGSGNYHMVYRVVGVYSPNEDNDTWVEYEREHTLERFTCRMEAFFSRFTRIVD